MGKHSLRQKSLSWKATSKEVLITLSKKSNDLFKFSPLKWTFFTKWFLIFWPLKYIFLTKWLKRGFVKLNLTGKCLFFVLMQYFLCTNLIFHIVISKPKCWSYSKCPFTWKMYDGHFILNLISISREKSSNLKKEFPNYDVGKKLKIFHYVCQVKDAFFVLSLCL